MGASICPPQTALVGFIPPCPWRPSRPQSAPSVNGDKRTADQSANGKPGASAELTRLLLLFTRADPDPWRQRGQAHPSPPPLGPRPQACLQMGTQAEKVRGLLLREPPQADGGTVAAGHHPASAGDGHTQLHISLAPTLPCMQEWLKLTTVGARSPTHLGGGLHPVPVAAPQSMAPQPIRRE